MPWKETRVMDERMKFIGRLLVVDVELGVRAFSEQLLPRALLFGPALDTVRAFCCRGAHVFCALLGALRCERFFVLYLARPSFTPKPICFFGGSGNSGGSIRSMIRARMSTIAESWVSSRALTSRSKVASLRANSRVLQEPKPVIGVSRLAASGVAIAVKPWVNVPDYGPASAEVSRAILEAFRSREIVIPFPQREVRMLAA